MILSRTIPVIVTLTILGAVGLFIVAEPIVAAVQVATGPVLVGGGIMLTLTCGVALLWFAWDRYEHAAERRAKRRLAEAEADLKVAEARKARRDSEVYVVMARQDEAVYISDAPGQWRAAHLDPRRYANGLQTDRIPQAVEVAAWSDWHHSHATAKPLASGIGSTGLPVAHSLPPCPTWPSKIDLLDLLPHGPTLQNVILGVTMDHTGQQQVIGAPLSKLVHIAVGGSSGWGKSVFLRSMAYQIMTAPEPVEVALIDLEATTFAPFALDPRLKCAIADTEQDALFILRYLIEELELRKGLFKAYPTAEKLGDYNQVADNPLPIIALLIDEATALLADKAVEDQIRTLALRARKYGIYAVLGGQDWKAGSLDTAIRNQLSTRVQFKAQDGTQSRVLLGTSEAASIEVIGRAYAVLPGRPRIEMQAPHIDLSTIASRMEPNGLEVPVPAEMLMPEPEPTEEEVVILSMYDQQASYREITTAVWGKHGKFYNNKVETVLADFGRM